MNLQFLGAAHTVTGSCYLLEANDHKVLIDCGMFQGARNLRDLNYNDFRFCTVRYRLRTFNSCSC